MRRLPILEFLVVAIVVVSAVLIVRATNEAEALVRNEWTSFRLVNRLDRSGPLPGELARVEGTHAYRHAGYLYAAYVPGKEGPVAADLTSIEDPPADRRTDAPGQGIA